jgi:hypothetical protein
MSRLAVAVGLGLMLALAVTACGSSAVSSRPGTVAPSATPAAPSGAASGAASAAGDASQTDTDWGRIWDALPPGFPTYPGSTTADDAATGPASATLVVDGDAAKAIGTWMASHLEAASYRTESISGPLEDGSYVVESVGATSGCRVQVKAAPLGSLTTINVMYGAACPNP